MYRWLGGRYHELYLSDNMREGEMNAPDSFLSHVRAMIYMSAPRASWAASMCDELRPIIQVLVNCFMIIATSPASPPPPPARCGSRDPS